MRATTLATKKTVESRLVCHPTTTCAAVHDLVARLALDEHRLRLAYDLHGDLAQLRIPTHGDRNRVDGLWKHSCFEIFIRAGHGPVYLEFNFAPSGEWAAYRFDDYRKRGAPIEHISPPEIHVAQARDRLELEAVIPLQRLLTVEGPLRLGLSAVIESSEGGLSYWALKHPVQKPDFHHPDSFVLSLPMDDRPLS